MRTKIGVVTSNKMQKTLVVAVTSQKSHPKYKKRYTVSKKFYAHCEEPTDFNIGDDVTIQESKPISKLKRWVVTTSEEKK
jgi:small subunit ribosomal protein S17